MLKVIQLPLPQLNAQLAAIIVKTILAELKSKPVLLLLSGGSCLNFYHELFTKLLTAKANLGALHISVQDERYKSADELNHADSNWAQIKAQFKPELKLLKERGAKLKGMLSKGNALQVAAKYSQFLQKHMQTSAVIAVNGIGADLHTSGIMPLPKEQFDKVFMGDKLVIAHSHGPVGTKKRITISPQVLSSSAHAFIYATGESKKLPLQQLLTSKLAINKAPAKLLVNLADLANVYLGTDVEV